MALELKKINEENMEGIKKIYHDSFPIEEMMPFDKLVSLSNDTDHLFYGLYDDNMLVGMNYLIINEDMVYVLYLAISNAFQNKGYGKVAINRILEQYSGYRISLNIEEVTPESLNYNQRLRRKSFYEFFGFESQQHLISNGEVTFETMVLNGDVSYQEIRRIFDDLQKHKSDWYREVN
ncbi:GNAT family N-acetyltransferase [Jeotgalibacillus terrae]|uniref:GNAT family N-acetyltransferase n=1 Tax=Jeotgalibacillus terrae TaxID=587735 RepID=A0ABW5ZII0_9BACL|nr:GNAT family N-acetyltransferase [Jeotgalibacillus terrae]MBM7579624.1 GNAT superfamily N-acetyltransferase [Jeotgalibacillus terrae]